MNIAMVTVKWRQTLQYLQVGKQLLVDKQACIVTVVQELIFLNILIQNILIQLGDVQINIIVLGDNSLSAACSCG